MYFQKKKTMKKYALSYSTLKLCKPKMKNSFSSMVDVEDLSNLYEKAKEVYKKVLHYKKCFLISNTS